MYSCSETIRTVPMDIEESTTTFNARDSRRETISSMKHFTWQDYVTLVLTESGHVTSASIQRLKDGAVWAASKDFCLSPDEIMTINDGFNDDIKLRQSGIQLNGCHFTLTRTSGRFVMVGREEKTGSGCVLFRCQSCLVTGFYVENNHPGQCYTLITQLGDYLTECGF